MFKNANETMYVTVATFSKNSQNAGFYTMLIGLCVTRSMLRYAISVILKIFDGLKYLLSKQNKWINTCFSSIFFVCVCVCSVIFVKKSACLVVLTFISQENMGLP